jgi:CheY-like chemotaxis protein
MIDVLVVEDDAEKLRRILSCLENLPGYSLERVADARDAWTAKKLLSKERYDLLIIDIAIPPRPDQPVDKFGGIELLEEITEREGFHKPSHVVGITGYPDVLETSMRRFAQVV